MCVLNCALFKLHENNIFVGTQHKGKYWVTTNVCM